MTSNSQIDRFFPLMLHGHHDAFAGVTMSNVAT